MPFVLTSCYSGRSIKNYHHKADMDDPTTWNKFFTIKVHHIGDEAPVSIHPVTHPKSYLTMSQEDADSNGSKYLEIDDGDFQPKNFLQRQAMQRRAAQQRASRQAYADDLMSSSGLLENDPEKEEGEEDASTMDDESSSSSRLNDSTQGSSSSRCSDHNSSFPPEKPTRECFTAEQLSGLWTFELLDNDSYKVQNFYRTDFIITTDEGEDEGLIVSHVRNVSDVDRCSYRIESDRS